ncbi:MAG: methionine adenosyltransferase [Candidatus Cloacimonetes bacterium]|nr:methionine adenosyltransferase [Candidatus Cloacimonadota bacterium]
MTALHEKESQLEGSFVFTSESVSEGHPDKVCDQVSDAILDAFLRADKYSRVACETLATQDTLVLAGEISSRVQVDVETIARDVIMRIGYVHPNQGFDYNCKINNYLHQQEKALEANTGAGDQGLMFGYACNQTKHLMPIPIILSHKILLNLAQVRKAGVISALLPDAKSQVSFRFVDRQPVDLQTVVLSTHHQPLGNSDFIELKRQINDLVIQPAIEEIESESRHHFTTNQCSIKINPLGMWEDGGPASDTGLTGRKIIVDTYGGWAQHGGGAFSGKDATKVDRSAAYVARHIAKSVVASGLADECLLQFSFVIGEAEPVSLMVDTFGSGKMSERSIEELIRRNFNLTVLGIIEYLDLRKPVYLDTAAYGHFGRTDIEFTWEEIKELK